VKDDGYALVLSGGGAKGVYHIGVWQALRETGVTIRAVIGSSVGAIIAGFVAQDEFEKAESIISDIGIDKVVMIPEQLVKDGQIEVTRKNLKYIKKLQEDVREKGGFDTKPLRRILENHLDEKKIRKKGMDFGIVTYQVSDFKPTEIFIEDIDEGYLLDYILASASLPGFIMTEIKKKKFIDGGVYNNIPFSMAKERGHKKIIIVDISGAGLNRRPDTIGTETIYIKNSIKMGGVLDFDKEFLRDYRKLGYLDTLKVLNKIKGIHYFYRPDEKIYTALTHLLHDEQVRKDYAYLLEFSDCKDESNRNLRLKGLLPGEMRHYQFPLYCFAECAAWSLNIEKLKLYDFKEFITLIHEHYLSVEESIRELSQQLSVKTIKDLIKSVVYLSKHTHLDALREKSVFEYDRILEKLLQSRKEKIPFSTLSHFFEQLAPAKLFIILLERYFT
jgi:NTE family protein